MAAFVERDILYALRGLRRTRSFTVTVLLTLAFGIGANIPTIPLRRPRPKSVITATGPVTKIVDHAEPYLDETPSWFPDGRRVAFQSDRTGMMQVWVMNAGGSAAHTLTK